MRKITPTPLRFFQHLAAGILALVAFTAVTFWSGEPRAHALPEYARRTGEPCAACHVNPGGGGPRTLRGLLWSARGKPDALPDLPGLALAPGVTDGQELYEIACAGCHGAKGEGQYAIALAGAGISASALRSFILEGIPGLGMPRFEGKFEAGQLDALVDYLARLSSGEVEPPPDRYPLPAARFQCDPPAGQSSCGGQ